MANISRVPNRPDYLTGFGSVSESPGSEAASGLMDKAKDAATSVVEKVEDAASVVQQTAQDAVSLVGQRASDAACAIGHGVNAGAGYVRDSVSDAAGNLTTLIRNHPIPSLLVSFAIGLLLSRATRR